MENYHQLLRLTMEQGVDQYNTRTNKLCRALVGHQVQFDLRQGFPALTTRKLPFKNIVGELLGFFRGYDNAAVLHITLFLFKHESTNAPKYTTY